MANQDAKELSMDEILASIRSILHENGNSRSKEQKPEEKADVSLSQYSDVQSVIGKRFDVFAPEPKAEPIFGSDVAPLPEETTEPAEDDVAAICNNIQKMMQKSAEGEKNFTISVEPQSEVENGQDIVQNETKTEPVAAHASEKTNQDFDYSDKIIQDFAAVFANRRKLYPVADISVQSLAQAAVINEVVPVLQQWLNEYLPNLVRKEIDRVMVKADKR